MRSLWFITLVSFDFYGYLAKGKFVNIFSLIFYIPCITINITEAKNPQLLIESGFKSEAGYNDAW